VSGRLYLEVRLSVYELKLQLQAREKKHKSGC